MKPWNRWLACLGSVGLSLALVGCGGGNSIPDPDSDSHAAKGAMPTPSTPLPAAAQNEPEPAPAPVAAPAPAPAPAPAAAPEPAAAAAPAPIPVAEAPKPQDPAPPSPVPAAAATEPAAAVAADSSPPPAAAPAAASPSPAPAPAADAKANNPFAVFSETQSAPPAATSAPAAAGAAVAAGATAATVPSAEVPPDLPPPVGEAPAEPGRNERPLDYLAAAAANRGDAKLFNDAASAAATFLAAIRAKDLNLIAQATALHAATESKNQKLFQLILSQELAQEDVDELSKKLDGYQLAGMNQAKSSGIVGITLTKSDGTSILRRTMTMRHEKAGWKVQDISGQGELVMPRSGRNTASGRR